MKEIWTEVKTAWQYMQLRREPRLSGPPGLHVLFMAAMTLIWSLLAVAGWLILLENIDPDLRTGEESWSQIATLYAMELLSRPNLLPFLLAAGFCSLLALHCATAALGLGWHANQQFKKKDELRPEQANP